MNEQFELHNFNEFLKTALKQKNISVDRLSEITNITPQYLLAFINDDFSKLPSKPYVRGYIQSLADVFGVDGDQLWKSYVRYADIKKSGEHDVLPHNRFALKRFSKRFIVLFLAVVVGLAVCIPLLADYFKRPMLVVTMPAFDNFVTESSTMVLQGSVKNPEDKVTINGEEIIVAPDGTFQKEVLLSSDGVTSFEFAVKRFLGKEMTITRAVIFKKNPLTNTNSDIVVHSTTTSATTSSSTVHETNP